MSDWLPFEAPIQALHDSAKELRGKGGAGTEAALLEERAARQLAHLYGQLTPWQRTQVARHPKRPHVRHFIAGLFTDFVPLAGDRRYGEDAAIVGGLARFEGRAVMVLGHAKGEDTAGRLHHNFGMARPEGYRKAVRLMTLADRFGLPVVTLVDTPGAFPGIDAEERGQAEAIARTIDRCLSLSVPLVAVITGEGGSGGAVAIAAADRVLMFEHSVYAVISPEGCASILWRNPGRAADAAEAMRLTASDQLALGAIDRIVYEPAGGAHRDHRTSIRRLAVALAEELGALDGRTAEVLREDRRRKYLGMGASAPA